MAILSMTGLYHRHTSYTTERTLPGEHGTCVSSPIQFAVRADAKKNNVLIVLNKNCSIIARDIDAPTIGEYPVDRMIVEERMEWFIGKQQQPFR